MKLTIPPKFKIGAHTFRIVWDEKHLLDLSLRGEIDYRKQIIRLMPDHPNSATFEALIHEILHGVNATSDIKSSEHYTNLTSQSLTQVLMSLGIEPDFSQIKEE